MKKILIMILILIGLSGVVFGQVACENIGCTPGDPEEGNALCQFVTGPIGEYTEIECNFCVSGVPTTPAVGEPEAIGHCEPESIDGEVPEINTMGIVAIVAMAGIAGFMVLRKK